MNTHAAVGDGDAAAAAVHAVGTVVTFEPVERTGFG
jgi:hypothetical protein